MLTVWKRYHVVVLTVEYFCYSKVYMILMCQLSISAAFIAGFVYNQGLRDYARNTPSLVLIAFIVTIVCILAMSCFESARRTAPANYIFLFVFTVAESFFLAVISSRYHANEVILDSTYWYYLYFLLSTFISISLKGIKGKTILQLNSVF